MVYVDDKENNSTWIYNNFALPEGPSKVTFTYEKWNEAEFSDMTAQIEFLKIDGT
jgi:hypothetical protein